jgi:hypothetical protein
MFKNQHYTGLLARMGKNAQDIAQAMQLTGGTQYAIEPTEESGHTSQAMFGHNMGINDFRTPEAQYAARQDELSNKLGVATIGKEGTLGAARINAAEKWDEFRHAPQRVGIAEKLFLSPVIQKAQGLGPMLEGNINETVAKGRAGERIRAGKGTPGDLTVWNDAGGSGSRSGGKPREVGGSDIADVEALVSQRYKGSSVIGKDKKVRFSDPFAAGLPAGQRVKAQRAAAEILANGGTIAQASDAYDYTLFPPERPKPQDGAAAPSPQDGQAPVKISNDAEFDALPPGAQFIDPNGQVRVKPGAAAPARPQAPAATPQQAPAQAAPARVAMNDEMPVMTEASYRPALPGLFTVQAQGVPQQAAPVQQAPVQQAFPSELAAQQAVDGPDDAEARRFLGMPPKEAQQQTVTDEAFRGVPLTLAMQIANDPRQDTATRRAAMAYVQRGGKVSPGKKKSLYYSTFTNARDANDALAGSRYGDSANVSSRNFFANQGR